jgi:arginine decarboxylase
MPGFGSVVPRFVFFTKGVGRHKEKLASFELALRKAGIAQFNLVRVSSIFPPYAKLVTPEHGLEHLSPGQIVFLVLAEAATDENNRLASASIGVAIPRDRNRYGYLSEHHAFGETAKEAGDYAEDLAAGMLASTLGIPFDADKNYDEKKEQYKFGGLIVSTRNITQTAEGRRGLWTTCIAAAVLIP